MDHKEMIEYKESFITKIKKFFLKLFGIHKENGSIVGEIVHKNVNDIQNEEQMIERTQTKNEFMNEIKVDTNEVDEVVRKENFLKEIDGNIEALNMLSIERLQRLEKYYDNIIEKNEKIIKKLETNS